MKLALVDETPEYFCFVDTSALTIDSWNIL